MNYRGYTIRKSESPWAIKYGLFYEYFNDERLYHACSIEEAKESIDERL